MNQEQRDELNDVVRLRLDAKRACDAAVGTPEYPALLKVFRDLDQRRDELNQAMRTHRS